MIKLEKKEKEEYTLMMPFFNRTGLERVGVVGPDLTTVGLVCRHWRCSPLQKQERRRADGAFAVAASMPKSVPRWEKR